MPDPVPVDALHDLTRVTALATAPDGERVAYTTVEYVPDDDERVTSLFVVPTDGSREPHRLTRVADAGAPTWGPDGDRLAFLATRETDVERRVGRSEAGADDGDDADDADDADADEANGVDPPPDDEPTPQVWLFDLARGGDARQVTDFEEGVSEFDVSPDGDRLVVAARDPTDEERTVIDRRRDGGPIETERLQHKVDGAGYLDDVTTYLFVVDVATGEATRLDDATGGGAFQALAGMEPAWGAGGRIAYTARHGDRPDATVARDCYTIGPDGSDRRRLTGGDLVVSTPAWDAAGERLAFAAGDPDNWCIPTQVYVHDGTGAGTDGADGDDDGADPDPEEPVGTYESVTADLDRTVARGAPLAWDGDAVYTLVGDEGRTRLIRAHADGTPPDRVFDAQGDARALATFSLPAGAGDAADGDERDGDADDAGSSEADPDAAGDDAAPRRATLLLSHPSDGRDVFAVDVADLGAAAPPDSLVRLTETNAGLLDDHAMPECDRIAWESDGERIEGLVYHAPDVDPTEGPHPLVVGIHGGPVSYDEPEFSFDHAVLASRGYLILRPNYRGGSSYGRAFAEALYGRWGTVEVDDVVAGVEEAVAEGWADPDRVFGYGYSYGGIAQGFLAARTDLFAAAAPEHGIYDLRSAFGTDDSQAWLAAEFGTPWDDPAAYDAASSITDVGDLDTPLLVMAGGEDWRCPPSQSEQLYVAARRQGVEAKLVIYPDEHHDVGDPDRATHRLSEILAWYERHDPAVETGETDGDGTNVETGEASDGTNVETDDGAAGVE